MHPKNLVTQTFRQRFGKEPAFVALAPGRVNILGEHVDYNDGFVLPAAIDTVGYENLTGEAVHDALIALSPFEPLNGVLRVDYSGGSRSPHMSQIRMIQGGPDKFIVIQDWTETPDLRPAK